MLPLSTWKLLVAVAAAEVELLVALLLQDLEAAAEVELWLGDAMRQVRYLQPYQSLSGLLLTVEPLEARIRLARLVTIVQLQMVDLLLPLLVVVQGARLLIAGVLLDQVEAAEELLAWVPQVQTHKRQAPMLEVTAVILL